MLLEQFLRIEKVKTSHCALCCHTKLERTLEKNVLIYEIISLKSLVFCIPALLGLFSYLHRINMQIRKLFFQHNDITNTGRQRVHHVYL